MPEYISMEELAAEIGKSLSGMNPKDYQYFDGLKNYRTVVFNNIVTDDIVESVLLPLKRFEEDSCLDPVTLIINTPGGSMADGAILLNIIDNYKKPLEILVYGYSCSMGTLLLCAGNKNPNVTKKCYPFTFFLFHPGHINIDDNTSAAMDYIEYQKKFDAILRDYVIANTNISTEEYDKHSRNEWYLFSDDAKRLGLIDIIIGVDDVDETK